MTALLTTLGIWFGAGIAILTIVDWILTERQKKRLTDWGAHAWIWLDDQRMGTFLNFLRKKTYQITASVVIMVVFLVFGILGILVLTTGLDDKKLFLLLGTYSLCLLAAMVFVAWKIHPRFTDWIMRSPSLKGFFGRCALIAGLSLGLTFGIETVLHLVTKDVDSAGMSDLLILAIVYLLTSPIRFEAGLVSTMLILSLAWLVTVLLLMALFAVMKFFLIRIVEYPKGPVLGLSGLLIAIAALIKVFM
jgi:hypothetical protein